jgi:acetyl-CoA acyltransferase 2
VHADAQPRCASADPFRSITAENLAVKYGITREQCDAYALQSQQRWQAANKAGAFADEISPVEVKVKRVSRGSALCGSYRPASADRLAQAMETFSVDEHPRGQTTAESLAKLPSVFKKEGTVTAGNASGICDGAAANVVASEAAVQEFGLKPLARIVSYGVTACEPSIMGVSRGRQAALHKR